MPVEAVMSSPSFTPTERTRLRRRPQRGSFDRATVHAILDEALICHVAFALEGQAHQIPTVHARIGDRLYLHGASANRALRALADGAQACIAATLVDGLVLSRSAFHSSMNYRSVVIYGRGEEVTDPDEKMAVLEALVEHVTPGRWKDVRWPSPGEFAAVLVVRIPLEEASAKIRSGPPIEEPEDLALRTWAGVLPLSVAPGAPLADAHVPAGLEPPAHVVHWSRGTRP
jgi:hypothetical protein